MGGSVGALAYGVGATEYAALIHAGFTFVVVPESIRFELTGALRPGVTAKDVMLYILANHAKQQLTLDRVMEFGGPGLRVAVARRARHARQHGDRVLGQGGHRRGRRRDARVDRRARGPARTSASCASAWSTPDRRRRTTPAACTRSTCRRSAPWWRRPAIRRRGIPSDPTNGAYVSELGDVPHRHRLRRLVHRGQGRRHRHVRARDAGRGGRRPQRVADGVDFYIQFGSQAVEEYAREEGLARGLRSDTGVKVISPGCGACIGCGPGVSANAEQVTVSAINRNYQGRSGPGQLYLASPLNVAASAVAGKIVAYEEGMFGGPQSAEPGSGAKLPTQ